MNWQIRYLLIIILITLIIQGFANAQDYTRAKLWENDMRAFAEIDRRQTSPKNAVLFVGSSTITGWQTIRADFPNVALINRGFGGSRLEDVNYFAVHIVLPHKPKIIVLYAGENDIAEGKTAENVLASFKIFAGLVRKNLPRTRLLFISLKPSPSRWDRWPEMRRANDLIRSEIGRAKKTKFVDVATVMFDKNGEPRAEIYVSDKLHLSEEGYALWRRVLTPFLK